jgi:hypothetical protein
MSAIKQTSTFRQYNGIQCFCQQSLCLMPEPSNFAVCYYSELIQTDSFDELQMPDHLHWNLEHL